MKNNQQISEMAIRELMLQECCKTVVPGITRRPYTIHESMYVDGTTPTETPNILGSNERHARNT